MTLLAARNPPVKGPASNKPVAGKLFERGATFIKGIRPSDRVLVVHHLDADGYCSAAILLRALKGIGVSGARAESSDVEGLKDIIGRVRPGDFDKIIILDIDVPALKPEYERIGADTLIVDHHMVRTDFTANVTYVNPRLAGSELYQPVSYVIYKIASIVADSKNAEWLAVLGTVADFAFEDCKDLLRGWIDAKRKEDVPRSEFWEASKVLYGAIIYANAGRGDVVPGQILDMLMKASGVKEMLEDPVVRLASGKFEQDYARAKVEFLKNAETKGVLLIGKLDSQMKRLCAALSTDLSIENPGKIVVVLEQRGDRYKISARWQDGRVHLGELMAKCGRGGGHRNAAGGSIALDEVDEFKACLSRELGL